MLYRRTLNLHQKEASKEQGMAEKVLYYHNEIYKAIKDRNAEKAAEMMYKHIEVIENVLKEKP